MPIYRPEVSPQQPQERAAASIPGQRVLVEIVQLAPPRIGEHIS
jgi:hypothetical protein